jgi:outer membrane receptor protein involved in Fe transport
MKQQRGGAAIAALIVMAMPQAAAGQTANIQTYNIPEQDLGAALRSFAATSGREIVAASADLDGKHSGSAVGALAPEQAVEKLLAGTGLSFRIVDGAFVVRPANAAGKPQSTSKDIIVTGSRIRGAPLASTVIRLNRDAMLDAGQSSAADALRAIPQNFGGGQNPGIGSNVPEAKGADVSGGASVNLRGLGSDATLTLLDGRRLSFDAALQSVDVSAIPFGAIERIDIVPDGASALYGSDAVAGVVNIILRRDFSGLETSARVAGSTDGGNFQQQYDATVGQTWGSGSALLAYEFARTTPIVASERSYAATRTPGVTLYPYLRHHNAALTVRQDILPGLTFDLDGLYNKRWRALTAPLDPSGDLAANRFDGLNTAESWAVAPSLTLALPADWQAVLAGSYGWNRVGYGGTYVFGGTALDAGSGTYRNVTENAELSGNGKLIDLPGGAMKLAIGAGYRRNGFSRASTRGVQDRVDHGQDSYYGFAELSVPLVGASEKRPLIDRLDLSLAARYERYPGLASVATPKLGIIYAPAPDIALKGSWGRSFRAATLYEQYSPRTAYLYDAASLGGAAGGTAILVEGGNPALRPERSTNWSATLAIHPRGIDGADLEISYFSVHYRDRIVTPILFEDTALTDPLDRDRVTPDPDAAAQAATLAQAVTFTNLASGPYDPATVVATVDNSNVNAGRQTVGGIDVLGRYRFLLGGGELSTTLDMSYLDSNQQIGSGQPVTQLAGIVFNPPHVRGRGELSWSGGCLTITGDISYIGSVRDTREAPSERVDGMTPVDLTLRYRTKRGRRLLDGIDLIASVQNLFNARPAPIATQLFLDTPYDSTNYSPFGRVLSLTVAKTW